MAKKIEHIINGVEIMPEMFKAFELWSDPTTHYTIAQIAERVGRHWRTVSVWRQTEWWHELAEQYIRTSRRRLETRFAALEEKIMQAAHDILDGKNKETNKMANAQVALITNYLKAGKDPIIDLRPNVQIDARTQIVNNNVTITPEMINSLPPGAIREYHRTGVLPKELK